MPLGLVARFGKIDRVEIMTIKQNLQMKVRPRGRSRAADLRNRVSGADVRTNGNQQLRTVPVSRHQGFAGRGIALDNDAQAVTAGTVTTPS